MQYSLSIFYVLYLRNHWLVARGRFQKYEIFLPNKAPARGLGSTQNSELEEQ